jgi:hypothetical protein
MTIFGPETDEIVGGLRKWHDEELHNLYSPPAIIRMIKSKRVGLKGHVARMERRGMRIGFWQKSQKERDRWEEVHPGGRIILKWILEK